MTGLTQLEQTNQLRGALLNLAEALLASRPEEGWRDRLDVLQQYLGEELCRRVGIFRLPGDFKLSVVIPAYNEVDTIESILQRVRDTGLPLELIVVDDGSRDGTRDLLARLRDRDGFELVLHERNQGKGAAVRTGMMRATGDVVVIQDADLEYDPQDFHLLLQPIVAGEADVVYGTRFGHSGRVSPLWHQRGNEFLTFLSNLRTGLRLSDVETCYKMFRRELIAPIASTLRETGFGIELEVTAKIARAPGVRIVERPISYARRSYAEGKKIGLKDAFWALWCIARY